jgi:hypothetical protein
MSAMYPLQIWIDPLGICRISKTNVLINQLNHVRHRTASTRCPFYRQVWKQLTFKNVCIWKTFCAMLYTIKLLNLCSWQRRFLSLCVYIMHIYSICKYSIIHYIHICTYMHPHWKPLHPLCSQSGEGPGSRKSVCDIKIFNTAEYWRTPTFPKNPSRNVKV